MDVSRADVSTSVRREGLDNAWSAERCTEYLMLCGAVTEAAWLARALGDWKAATLIGVAVKRHQKMLPQLYDRYVQWLSDPILLILFTYVW